VLVHVPLPQPGGIEHRPGRRQGAERGPEGQFLRGRVERDLAELAAGDIQPADRGPAGIAYLAGLGGGFLGRVYQGVVRLGGAGCHDAKGFDERGEFGLDRLSVGVVGGDALCFDEAADSFEVVDAQ
jgi:hypothetical protein